MWKTYNVLVLAVMLNLVACGPDHPIRTEEHPAAVPAGSAPDAALASQRLADAKKLIAEGSWPEAIETLQEIIETTSFSRLSDALQHEALMAAGEAALDHGSSKLAFEYLIRATSLPEARFEDWFWRLEAATKVGNSADTVTTLTVLVQRWPARSIQIPPKYILSVIDEFKHCAPDAALALLLGLYDAHWKLRWDIEPSVAWRDLILRLVEKGRLAHAIDVSSHVTDVYVLISMRADRRFDAVIAANAAHFDIEEAAKQAFRTFQSAAEHAPDSLELQFGVIDSLRSQQRYEAALAACDSVLFNLRSTNYPEKLYSDYDDAYSWILDERARLLERVGRWDEAVAQLTSASKLPQNHGGHVAHLINLAHLYCDLDRPRESQQVLARITSMEKPQGAMYLEEVRLNAAYQQGDNIQVARSMKLLEQHRAESPDSYEDALIFVNQLDRAAKLLVERLRDRTQRAQALADVQTYAIPLRVARQVEYDARWRAVLGRPDVKAAIRQVGRIEVYKLEEQ